MKEKATNYILYIPMKSPKEDITSLFPKRKEGGLELNFLSLGNDIDNPIGTLLQCRFDPPLTPTEVGRVSKKLAEEGYEFYYVPAQSPYFRSG